jgi:formylglycine-generating enzyme required for sulfatase activity
LHDTAGNLHEWVEDCWHDAYEGAPEDGSPWLESGGGDCGRRVLRGGSWYNEPRYVRSATRYRNTADFRFTDVGFRLAQDIN